MTKTAVLLPAYNEEVSIASMIILSENYADEVIVVDDGSNDRTAQIAEKTNATVIRHEKNKGKGAALKTGFDYVKNKDFDILVTIDADGQHNPEDLYNMYPPIENGEADVVIAARDFNDMPRGRKFGNTVMNYITYIFQGKMVKDSQSGLRAFSRKAAQMITLNSPQYGVSSEIIGEIERKNLKLKEVPMTTIYDQRTIEKGTNLFVGLKIVFEFMNEMFK